MATCSERGPGQRSRFCAWSALRGAATAATRLFWVSFDSGLLTKQILLPWPERCCCEAREISSWPWHAACGVQPATCDSQPCRRRGCFRSATGRHRRTHARHCLGRRSVPSHSGASGGGNTTGLIMLHVACCMLHVACCMLHVLCSSIALPWRMVDAALPAAWLSIVHHTLHRCRTFDACELGRALCRLRLHVVCAPLPHM